MVGIVTLFLSPVWVLAARARSRHMKPRSRSLPPGRASPRPSSTGKPPVNRRPRLWSGYRPPRPRPSAPESISRSSAAGGGRSSRSDPRLVAAQFVLTYRSAGETALYDLAREYRQPPAKLHRPPQYLTIRLSSPPTAGVHFRYSCRRDERPHNFAGSNCPILLANSHLFFGIFALVPTTCRPLAHSPALPHATTQTDASRSSIHRRLRHLPRRDWRTKPRTNPIPVRNRKKTSSHALRWHEFSLCPRVYPLCSPMPCLLRVSVPLW